MSLYALFLALRRLCRPAPHAEAARPGRTTGDAQAAVARADDDHHVACGWFESSWELTRGVDVEEHVWLDAGLPNDALALAVRFE